MQERCCLWVRRAGPPLPRRPEAGTPREPGVRGGLTQELAPGRRATCFVSLLVTLSVLGRPDRAAQAGAWSSCPSSAPYSPPPKMSPRKQPLQRGRWAPQQKKSQGMASAIPELLQGEPRLPLRSGSEGTSALTQAASPLSFFFFLFFHLLHSLPPSVLFGSFST